MSSADPDRGLRAVSQLTEPLRRRLYDHVCALDRPVSREEAARSGGISRSLAAYHLDKLAEDGLLSVSYARTSERPGPGAGRTAKLYRASNEEFVVSVPARHYELAAELLAGAVDDDTSGAVRERAERIAYEYGLSAGRAVAPSNRPVSDDDLIATLAARGYRPNSEDNGAIRFSNCPFHRLVPAHRDLVCSMNLTLITGLLDGMKAEPYSAHLERRPNCCCVAIRRG